MNRDDADVKLGQSSYNFIILAMVKIDGKTLLKIRKK